MCLESVVRNTLCSVSHFIIDMLSCLTGDCRNSCHWCQCLIFFLILNKYVRTGSPHNTQYFVYHACQSKQSFCVQTLYTYWTYVFTPRRVWIFRQHSVCKSKHSRLQEVQKEAQASRIHFTRDKQNLVGKMLEGAVCVSVDANKILWESFFLSLE